MPRLVAVCAALAAASLLFVPAAPGNDPWVWILWGRELLELDLDTTLGASWKPLPVLFTTPFSLFGDFAVELWTIVARGGALLGVALAFRLAYRLALGERPPTGRERAIAAGAGVLAAGCLVLLVEHSVQGGPARFGYVRYAADARIEGLFVALMLLAVDRAVQRRHGQALVAGGLAALARPEVWPFLAAYAAWTAWREPRLRLAAAGVLAGVAALWVLPDWWGSGELLAAGRTAAESVQGNELGGDPVLVLKRMNGLLIGPVEYAALVALGFAVARREVATLVLGAGAVIWLLGSAFATEFGYPGVARLLLPAAAIVFVLGGVGAARIVQALGAGRGAIAVGLLLVAGAAPFGWRAVEPLREVPGAVEQRADSQHDFELVTLRAGGAEPIRACGRASVDALVRYEPDEPILHRTGWPRIELAWLLDRHVDEIRRRVPSGRRTAVLIQSGRLNVGRPPPRRGRRVARAGGWELYAFGGCGLGSTAG